MTALHRKFQFNCSISRKNSHAIDRTLRNGESLFYLTLSLLSLFFSLLFSLSHVIFFLKNNIYKYVFFSYFFFRQLRIYSLFFVCLQLQSHIVFLRRFCGFAEADCKYVNGILMHELLYIFMLKSNRIYKHDISNTNPLKPISPLYSCRNSIASWLRINIHLLIRVFSENNSIQLWMRINLLLFTYFMKGNK